MSDVVQTGTYPIAENVMLFARAVINDMLRTAAGAILVDSAPFTPVFLNAAIRKTQRYLAVNGLYSQVIDNAILTPVTAVANQDPATQVFINQNGYYDGVSTHSNVVLPPDLILPLMVAQRVTGSGAQFIPMEPAKGPLMSRIPGPYFGDWEFRGDGLYLNGSTNSMDLRIRYEAAIARIAAGANLQQTSIPIRDGEDALGWGVVSIYAASRGAAQRAEAKAMWLEECDTLINRYVRAGQRIAVRPKGFAAGGGTIDGALSGDYR
ncbi:MAG: hypothetical protein HRJ53_26730 [Acidobacteria bacterium Pan2503]|uniref:Uncharacterized protein n=1 Tax=Candidatus Acidiferrum panamense TaxID=2741543 RepID=A0A7V8NW38_9BACT|nr:hypothetical protein [Candidatus Acidoferrum panamensis]